MFNKFQKWLNESDHFTPIYPRCVVCGHPIDVPDICTECVKWAAMIEVHYRPWSINSVLDACSLMGIRRFP